MTTEYSGSGDLNRSLALLWDMDPRPSRGPKPALTVDRIVRTAVSIADADGLTAVSMRRVATELGVGTMSLYRYVPGKAELLDLMLDMVEGVPGEDGDEDDTADPAAGGWRKLLEDSAMGMWDLYLAHPWLLQIDQARPLLGPRALAGLDYLMRGLRKTSLTDQQKMLAVTTVYCFVSGVARDHVNALQATARTGITDEEFWAAQEPVLIKAMESGRFPTLATMGEDTFDITGEGMRDFGLANLLDGFAMYIERQDQRRAETRANDPTGDPTGDPQET